MTIFYSFMGLVVIFLGAIMASHDRSAFWLWVAGILIGFGFGAGITGGVQ